MDFYSAHHGKIAKKKGYTPISKHTGHAATYQAYVRRIAMRTIGNLMIIFALYMLSWVFYKPVIEEVRYAYNNITGKEYVLEDDLRREAFRTARSETEPNLLTQVLGGRKVQPIVPKDPEFSIVIPKLGANANVVSNVDTARDAEYLEALRKGVAHAAGTGFPGQDRHIYMFAHSTNTFSNVTRYNAVFYLLYKLEPGDEVNVYYKGIRHKYAVTGKKIVDPSEVYYLTRQTANEFLTLQTCWPPGTIAKRMLIFAEPIVN